MDGIENLFQKLLPPATKLGQGYVFTHVWDSVHRGGWYPSMHCSRSPGRGVVSQQALQVSRATPRGEVEGDLAGGVSRPTPKGDLVRGVSRPKPKGEVEGDLARGVFRPTPKGEV